MGAKNPAALKGNRPFDESGKEGGRQVGRPERHQRTLHAPCTKIRRLNEQRRTAKAAKAVGENNRVRRARVLGKRVSRYSAVSRSLPDLAAGGKNGDASQTKNPERKLSHFAQRVIRCEARELRNVDGRELPDGAGLIADGIRGTSAIPDKGPPPKRVQTRAIRFQEIDAHARSAKGPDYHLIARLEDRLYFQKITKCDKSCVFQAHGIAQWVGAQIPRKGNDSPFNYI